MDLREVIKQSVLKDVSEEQAETVTNKILEYLGDSEKFKVEKIEKEMD